MNWSTNQGWGLNLGQPATTPAGPGSEPPATAAPEPVIDVGEADFETQVLDRSMQVPVLLDCWAPWCGPCRSLGPLLEKLAREYGGRFVLAKMNTDEAPQISAALRIRSIPQCFLFVGGRPVDQFTGALPEGQLRAFLDKHLGPQVDPIEALREEVAQVAATDPAGAEALLREGLAYAPGHPALTLDLADRLLARGALDEAQGLLDGLPETALDGAGKARHAGLAKRLAIARSKPAGDPEQLAERIAANPRDFEARLALGAIHMHAGAWRAAFEQLLEIVLRDKGTDEDSWRQRARRQLVEWFDACPDAEAVSHGRRYLGMYLN